MRRKIVCAIFIFLIVSSIILTANASTTDDCVVQAEARFTYIDAVGAQISIDTSTGIATCTGIGYAKATDDVVLLTVQLQRCENNVWYTLKTWSGSDVNMAVVTGRYAVYSGYTYRTKVSMILYDSNGNYLESATGTQETTY